MSYHLLTDSNPKLKKSSARGWLSAGLHLAPAASSGFEVCPGRSKGCTLACLATAGHGAMEEATNARIRRTRLLYQDRSKFLALLHSDIMRHVACAAREGLRPCVRLNLTSDVAWEDLGVMAQWPLAQFYDYTKVWRRMQRFMEGRMPPNYYLTWSASETRSNKAHCKEVLQRGFNVAVPVADPISPVTRRLLEQYNVVHGDEDDLRFLDPRPSIVVLKPKGRAKHDTSGFVWR